jgi:hypothetical protein
MIQKVVDTKGDFSKDIIKKIISLFNQYQEVGPIVTLIDNLIILFDIESKKDLEVLKELWGKDNFDFLENLEAVLFGCLCYHEKRVKKSALVLFSKVNLFIKKLNYEEETFFDLLISNTKNIIEKSKYHLFLKESNGLVENMKNQYEKLSCPEDILSISQSDDYFYLWPLILSELGKLAFEKQFYVLVNEAKRFVDDKIRSIPNIIELKVNQVDDSYAFKWYLKNFYFKDQFNFIKIFNKWNNNNQRKRTDF